MSTFKLMSQAGYSSLNLGSDDSKIEIYLRHFNSGRWEIERTSYGTPYLRTSRDITTSQAETLLNSYDARGMR